ncbi:porin [Massilia sp. Dwa41.01b]|uniref:porin n=1 Tax=unclassified Massilia TaxID=2609279 RepID=UPI0016012EF3|nr:MULTISPECIES: porin [unclassified Massilia]QNA89214.1 porin [Massilia sp. Dwa41.01b]QNB00118.1 porin [Massilia sp. Se16.2.3]
MKKTILAMAVLAACTSAASAQTSVTIYGIVDAGLTHVTNDGPTGDRTTVEAGQMLVSRWGFKGSDDIGGGLKARFALEGTLLNDTGGAGVPTGTPSNTALFDREATVGLAGNFGSIDIGRQNILGMGSVALADPMNSAFAATSPNVLFGGMNYAAVYGAYGANNGGSALRQSNSIKYVSPSFHGAGFALMRAFGEQANGFQKNSYQGASVFYNAGAFGGGAAYARMKNITDSDLLKSFGIGLKYSLPAVVLKSTYIQNELESTGRKIAILGLGVDVPVGPALTLNGAYYNTRRSGDLRDDSQQYIFIARYALSKRSTFYGSYGHAATDSVVRDGQINLAQGFVAVGSDSANRFTAGILHLF